LALRHRGATLSVPRSLATGDFPAIAQV